MVRNIQQIAAYVLIVVIAIVGFIKIGNQQEEGDRIQTCTIQYVSDFLFSVNQRTSLNRVQSDANLQLQGSQSKLIDSFLNPPKGVEVTKATAESLQKYFQALQKYQKIVNAQTTKVKENPYPSSKSYSDCIEDAK